VRWRGFRLRNLKLEELLARSTRDRRFGVVLLASLAGIALVLSIAGVYALMSFSTRRRTPEIGIRMAMGATRRQILSMVLVESATLAAYGIAFGLAGALAAGVLLQRFLFEVNAADLLTLAVVSLLLAAVSVAASFAPARRATQVDPAQALRAE
jgi:putative ABC transport system permease protein